MSAQQAADVVRIPWQQCYWAVVDDAATLSHESLHYQLEQVAPVPVDQLVIASARTQGQALLCAIEPQRLSTWLNEQGAVGAWSVMPDALPDFLAEQSFAKPAELLNQLDLATGPAASQRRRSGQRLSIIAAAVAAVLLLALVWAGFERRVGQWQQQAAAARALSYQHLGELFPEAAARPAALNAALIMGERRLVAQGGNQQHNASEVTQALFAAWPAQSRTRIEVLSITAERVQLRGQADEAQAVEALYAATQQLQLAHAGAWKAAPLQIQQRRNTMAFTIVWRPQEPSQ